jgi:calcium-dependent protein kinase
MSALTNLQNFNAQSKLKQATYAFIASQLLSKQEKEQIDKVFRAMDLNGDGKLQKDEIKKGYAEFFGRNLTDQEVDELF